MALSAVVENALQVTEPPPLGLYVHFPWCLRKCPYCDFNSHALHRELPETAYLEALLDDLEMELPQVAGRQIETVYCGGGTPSLFSADSFAALLDAVRQRLPLAAAAEVTVEVNPGTLRTGYFEALREAGVNRLSIGVQSFDDARLQALGRVHDAAAARATVAAAQRAGFDEINIDLMYGLPGQGVTAALEDLREGLDLGTCHLSHYQLTLEPGTPFAARPPRLPPEETVLDVQEEAAELFVRHGFEHYEVSAHAVPGHFARHNVNYWRFGDYLGIGAGAHGKLSGPAGIERRWRVASPQRYLKTAGSDAAVAGRRTLGIDDLALEFLMNALRLRRGFSTALFEARTGLAWSSQRDRVAQATELGLLVVEGGEVFASERGWQLLDTLLGLFVPDGDWATEMAGAD